MTTPTNLVIILSDEHQRDALGVYGHPIVQTPNLDSLAARGVRFTNAYTPCPMCVPARASLATGQWVHQTGYWDSATPYDGQVHGWAHHLVERGYTVASIGKLHHRSAEDDNGFSESLLPMYVLNGVGWVRGLIRENPPPYDDGTREYAEQVGVGESTYTAYDRAITAAACAWLTEHANEDKPWVLFVSLVNPHYPLIAPPEFHALYNPETVDLPRNYAPDQRPTHPEVRQFVDYYNYDAYFDEAQMRAARIAYYGLCSFLDDNIGRILTTLDTANLTASTHILYTSDHGEMLGNHGMWTKMTMYEESAAIPMILAGPDVPQNKTVDTPVSLIDIYQTAFDCVGESLASGAELLPGHSLLSIANDAQPDRIVISEFHDGGSTTGTFMLRLGRWKYVHYVGQPPQLFDLEVDRWESADLGQNPDYAHICQQCEAALRTVLDPELVNRQAFTDQKAKLTALGGREALSNYADFGFTPV